MKLNLDVVTRTINTPSTLQSLHAFAPTLDKPGRFFLYLSGLNDIKTQDTTPEK